MEMVFGREEFEVLAAEIAPKLGLVAHVVPMTPDQGTGVVVLFDSHWTVSCEIDLGNVKGKTAKEISDMFREKVSEAVGKMAEGLHEAIKDHLSGSFLERSTPCLKRPQGQ
jgi:hypothetical protein